jgi:hypothetical protein
MHKVYLLCASQARLRKFLLSGNLRRVYRCADSTEPEEEAANSKMSYPKRGKARRWLLADLRKKERWTLIKHFYGQFYPIFFDDCLTLEGEVTNKFSTLASLKMSEQSES